MIPYAQGVGFAIPSNTVKFVSNQILEHGRVIRPWLGISGANLNQALARRYDIPTDSGVLVVEIDSRGPAYEAGLRVGDVLVELGSQKVREMKDVISALSKHQVREYVDVRFVRLGGRRSASIRLIESPAQIIERR